MTAPERRRFRVGRRRTVHEERLPRPMSERHIMSICGWGGQIGVAVHLTADPASCKACLRVLAARERS